MSLGNLREAFQTFRSLDPSFQQLRVLHDRDHDGWCDLWLSLMSLQKPPADPNADFDGDGLSDYEEMLLWRDPRRAESLPRLLSNIEKQHLLLVRNARKEETEQPRFMIIAR